MRRPHLRRQFLKLFEAQLLIVVRVELLEQLRRLGRRGRRSGRTLGAIATGTFGAATWTEASAAARSMAARPSTFRAASFRPTSFRTAIAKPAWRSALGPARGANVAGAVGRGAAKSWTAFLDAGPFRRGPAGPPSARSWTAIGARTAQVAHDLAQCADEVPRLAALIVVELAVGVGVELSQRGLLRFLARRRSARRRALGFFLSARKRRQRACQHNGHGIFYRTHVVPRLPIRGES